MPISLRRQHASSGISIYSPQMYRRLNDPNRIFNGYQILSLRPTVSARSAFSLRLMIRCSPPQRYQHSASAEYFQKIWGMIESTHPCPLRRMIRARHICKIACLSNLGVIAVRLQVYCRDDCGRLKALK